MNSEEIHKKYFVPGSKGYKILSYYFSRYQDLFVKTIFSELDEFINQVYLNISSISITDKIKNPEAYIIAAIKIQCRVQLDSALKFKKKQLNEIAIESESDDENKSVFYDGKIAEENKYHPVESNELLTIINMFKLSLKEQEKILFNSLIDNISRNEIAQTMNQKLNTVDTHIRRLRIKFFSHLKKNGYLFEIFNKYDKKEKS